MGLLFRVRTWNTRIPCYAPKVSRLFRGVYHGANMGLTMGCRMAYSMVCPGFMYAVATEHYVRLSPDFFAFQHGEPFGRFLILGVAHLT